MYIARHDTERGHAVWILDRPTVEEWRRLTVDVVRVAHWPVEPRPLVLLVLEHFAPDARQSAHFVDLITESTFAPRIALVPVGALARTVEPALGPAIEAGHVALFDDAEDALEWLDAQRQGAGMGELVRDANLARPPMRATEPA
ncbi:MAG: hypothetical protein IT378_24815 [Sandaracinaceae bacterium]|nr:hypothetical protein [Sandaracinaceae bacterium]